MKHKSGPPEDEVAILQALLTNFAIDTVAGTGYFIQEERPDAVTATIRHLVAPKMSVGESRWPLLDTRHNRMTRPRFHGGGLL